MKKSIYCTALASILAGCATQKADEVVTLKQKTLDTDLVEYLTSISNKSDSEIAVSNFRGDNSALKLVYWCGTENDIRVLESDVGKACSNQDGASVNNWCYDPRTSKPHFLLETRQNDSSKFQCQNNQEWVTSLTRPNNHYTSIFWLADSRRMGFLTPEQSALRDRLKGALAKKNSDERFTEYLENTRDTIQRKYSNKSGIQGNYGHKVCQWDNEYKTLEGVTVGRVLATYENLFHLELVDYQSLSGASESFPKGSIIFGSYEDWSLCNG